MTALETAADPARDRFDSFEAMQAAHAELLEKLPDENLSGEDADRVRSFLTKGAATGTLLDHPGDRKSSQGLLDYWRATLYAESRSRGPNEVTGELASQRLTDAVLAPFDPGTIRAAVAAADRWLSTLPGADQKVARRVMLRLARLAPDKYTFEPMPTSRAALHEVDPSSAKVDEVVAALTGAGVVRVTKGNSPEADQVALRANELVTQWQTYADRLCERLKFREAVEEWDRRQRPADGLLEGDDLEEVRSYHDRNSLERKFIEQSWYRERRKGERDRRLKWVFGALSLFATGCLVAAVYFYSQAVKAERAKTTAEQAKTEAERSTRSALRTKGVADNRARMTLMIVLQRLYDDKGAQHVVKKILIVQTLGEVALANSPEGRAAAKDNWNLLEAHLKEAVWFPEHFLEKSKEDLEKVTNDGLPSAEKRKALLNISRYLRSAIRSHGEKPIVDPLESMRPHWFDQVDQAAGRLTDAANEGKRLEDVSVYSNLFWKLYCCELVIAGMTAGSSPDDDQEEAHKEVKAALAGFEQHLNDWEASQDGKAPVEVRRSMADMLTKLRKTRETEREGGS